MILLFLLLQSSTDFVLSYVAMDVGTGGTGDTCPNFSKTWAKWPFSCNLVALLESFENAEITGKIHVSSDFRGSKFQNFLGEYARGPPPLANLHL